VWADEDDAARERAAGAAPPAGETRPGGTARGKTPQVGVASGGGTRTQFEDTD